MKVHFYILVRIVINIYEILACSHYYRIYNVGILPLHPNVLNDEIYFKNLVIKFLCVNFYQTQSDTLLVRTYCPVTKNQTSITAVRFNNIHENACEEFICADCGRAYKIFLTTNNNRIKILLLACRVEKFIYMNIKQITLAFGIVFHIMRHH